MQAIKIYCAHTYLSFPLTNFDSLSENVASNLCKYTSFYIKENLLCLLYKLFTTLRASITIHWMRLDCIWRQGCLPFSTSTSHFNMLLWKKWCHPQVEMFQESISFLIVLSKIIQSTRNFVAFFLPVFLKHTFRRRMGLPIRSTEHMFWIFLGIICKWWKRHLSLFQATSM